MTDQATNTQADPDKPDFVVRPAVPQDDADLASFLIDAEPMASPALDVPSVMEAPDNPLFSDELGRWVWIARPTGQEAGPLAGSVTLHRVGQSTAQMSGLLVAPELRGKGIGEQLVKASLKFCGDQGMIKVLLDTLTGQKQAIHLFERVGFQLSRMKESNGRECMEFYLDLYRRPDGAGD